MDKDLKLLFRILIYCFVGLTILILISLFSLYVKGILICEYTGGNWIFNKADKNFCSSLNETECKVSVGCVRKGSLQGGFNFADAKCTPNTGCVCNETWYFSSGCSNGDEIHNEKIANWLLFSIFLSFTLICFILFLVIKKKFLKRSDDSFSLDKGIEKSPQ
jgi:hypothetical protein